MKTPAKYDSVVFYTEYRGIKFPNYIIYIDSTHVGITTDTPKPDSLAAIYHIGQLRHRSFYDAMVKWMKTGNKRDIDKKIFNESKELKKLREFIGEEVRRITKSGFSSYPLSMNEATRRSNDFFEDSKYGKLLHKMFKGKFNGNKFDKFISDLEEKTTSDVKYDRILNKIGGDIGMDVRKYNYMPLHKYISDMKSQVENLYKIHTESITERKYRDDPRWIKAKYPGRDAKGTPFKKGEQILYYPLTRKIYAGKEANSAWLEFISIAQDDDFMNSQFR